MCKRGVLPITFLLGEHQDAQKWCFVEDDEMAMLLIPKRYVFIATVFAYFIRLVPKEATDADKV